LKGVSIDLPETREDRLKDVPQEFKKYINLFRKEEEIGLPLKSKWDHAIKLKLKTQSGFNKIYPINQKERAILKDYINKNVTIGKIRKLKSKAGYPIFFVVKKNRGRQPYVNYRQLNNITKKN